MGRDHFNPDLGLTNVAPLNLREVSFGNMDAYSLNVRNLDSCKLLNSTLALGVDPNIVTVSNFAILDSHHQVRLAKTEDAPTLKIAECAVGQENNGVDEDGCCVEVRDVTLYFAAGHIHKGLWHRHDTGSFAFETLRHRVECKVAISEYDTAFKHHD